MTSRAQVVELANQGRPLSQIVQATGLTPQTVMGYVKTARAFGITVVTPKDDLLKPLVSPADASAVHNRLVSVLQGYFTTDYEASRAIGVPEPTVRAWRTKINMPGALHLIAICRACGITPNWLLLGRTPMNAGDEGRNDAA